MPPCVVPSQLLEEDIFTFVKEELKMIQRRLNSSDPEWPEGPEVGEEFQGCKEAFLKVTVHFLKKMKQEGLADLLQRGEEVPPRILDSLFFFSQEEF